MTINYLGIGLAALVSFFFGAVYYGGLSSQWLAALGKTKEEIERDGRSLPVSLAISLVLQLFMAWVFAGLVLHLGKSGVPVSVRNGLLSGAFMWAGFVVTTLVTNYWYGGRSMRLAAIDAGHWLGVLLIQGALISALAIR